MPVRILFAEPPKLFFGYVRSLRLVYLHLLAARLIMLCYLFLVPSHMRFHALVFLLGKNLLIVLEYAY